MNSQEALYVLDLIYTIFFFLSGACIGSFLNVCILRIPKGISVITPPSTCACGKLIKIYHNIPILAWFILRGKAHCCGAKISFRYAFIEMLTAVLFTLCYVLLDSPTSYVMMFFCSLMLVVSFIDIDTLELPDFLTAGGALLGFILSLILPDIHNASLSEYPYIFSLIRSAYYSFLGIIVGVGITYTFRYTAEVIFRREAMGEGDVLLMALIGSFCGWQGAIFAIFGGCLFGSIILLPLYPFFKKKGEDLMIPFGPWLALGAILYVLFFRDMTFAYFDNLQKLLSL